MQYFTRKFEKNQRWNLHAGEDAFAAAALSFQPYGASGRYAMRFAKVFLTWPAPHTGLERSLNFVNHSINTGIKFKKIFLLSRCRRCNKISSEDGYQTVQTQRGSSRFLKSWNDSERKSVCTQLSETEKPIITGVERFRNAGSGEWNIHKLFYDDINNKSNDLVIWVETNDTNVKFKEFSSKFSKMQVMIAFICRRNNTTEAL